MSYSPASHKSDDGLIPTKAAIALWPYNEAPEHLRLQYPSARPNDSWLIVLPPRFDIRDLTWLNFDLIKEYPHPTYKNWKLVIVTNDKL